MPNVVLPNIAGSPRPSEADLNQADAAIVAVVGGIAGGVRHPGALDLTNFAPGGRAFLNEQKLQPRSRVAIPVTTEGMSQHAYDTIVYAVQLWHTKREALAGDITLLMGGQGVASLRCPDPQGKLQVGARLAPYTVYEWQVPPFLVSARAPVDVQHTLAAEPAMPWLAFEELKITLWGTTLHK